MSCRGDMMLGSSANLLVRVCRSLVIFVKVSGSFAGYDQTYSTNGLCIDQYDV